MQHLIIRNIGPIEAVELELNKINIFMGPQSSGKSTIAKIISYCLWIEKNVCLLRKYKDIEDNFKQRLEEFHHLDDYINQDSYIGYESDYVCITYKPKEYISCIIEEKERIRSFDYKRAKVIYIPAERNLIAVPGWTSFNLPNDNLKSYTIDWGFTRRLFTKESPLQIKHLNVNYYFDDKNTKDFIQNDGVETLLTSSSSGIQTSTPLYLLQKVFCQYNKELAKNNSFEDASTLETVFQFFRLRTTVREDVTPPESEYFWYKGKYCIVKPGMKDKVIKVLDNYTEIQRVQSVIEEPELNLFPETQQKLIYELISDATNSENQITITTHSPYILFALNNCMMGGLVRDNIPEEDRPTFESYPSWIDPKLVSVYEIQDRTIRRIQDADGIIEDNYLNQAYKDNVNEYVGLLNYYDDEE